MAKDKDDMPTAHCRVGVQHRSEMHECAKYEVESDNTEEAPPDEGGDEGGEGGGGG